MGGGGGRGKYELKKRGDQGDGKLGGIRVGKKNL